MKRWNLALPMTFLCKMLRTRIQPIEPTLPLPVAQQVPPPYSASSESSDPSFHLWPHPFIQFLT